MNVDEKEKLKEHIRNWKDTSKFLEELRRKSIRESVVADSIGIFDDAFESAIYLGKPTSTSGFVEFYRILSKSK